MFEKAIYSRKRYFPDSKEATSTWSKLIFTEQREDPSLKFKSLLILNKIIRLMQTLH